MELTTASFAAHAAERLTAECAEISDAWLSRLPGETARAAPDLPALMMAATPELIRSVARFVVDDDYPIEQSDDTRDAVFMLARCYRAGGLEPGALLRELDSLAAVLDGACLRWVAAFNGGVKTDAAVRVSGRLNRAPLILGQLGVSMYWEEELAAREVPEHQVRSFADTLAHELKTPLNAAALTAQLLELADASRQEEVRRLGTLIRRNLERADAVLSNVRSMSLHLPPDARPLPEPFGQVLGAALEDVRDELAAADVRLELEEPIPAIRVDAVQVRLILSNLLRNAVLYRDPSKRPFVKVTFRRRASDGHWWAEVTDNGLGIPAEQQANVLTHAFRAHPERARGNGIGLTIVARAARQIGGDVEFHSVPGVGTTFRFSLPESQG